MIDCGEQPRRHPIELFGPEICRISGCLRLASTHVACSTAIPDAPGRGRPPAPQRSPVRRTGPPSPHELRGRTGPRPAGFPGGRRRSARTNAMARYRGRHRAPSTTGEPSPARPSPARSPGHPCSPPRRPTPPPTACGTAWPSARAAATGTSTPATASSAGSSSVLDLEGLRRRAVRGSPTRPAASSRSSSPSGCSPSRAGAHGRSAPARPGPRPAAHLRNAAPAAPKPCAAAPSPPPQRPRSRHYLVQRGDTLSSIASRQHVTGGYRALLAKNPALKNPNRIFPGQHLKV